MRYIIWITLVVILWTVTCTATIEEQVDVSTSTTLDTVDTRPVGVPPIQPTFRDVGEDDVYRALQLLHLGTALPFKRVVNLLHIASRKGNAEAMLYLGVLHTFGLGVVKSDAKALSYYTMASLGGNPEASVVLCHRYEKGIGVPLSLARAVAFAKEASESVAKAYRIEHRQHPTVVKLEEWDRHGRKSKSLIGINDEKVIQAHVYRSEQGNLESKMTLGYTFLYGLNAQEVDVSKALMHFEDALSKKHPAAYGALGQLYMQGVDDPIHPIPADHEKAFRLFEAGQELGDPGSMNGLGYFYARSAVLRTTFADQEERFKKAVEYYTKAAASGNADATYNLGVLKLHGRGVTKDPDSATTLFRVASGKGSLLANWQLGLLSLVGEAGMPQSNANALRFLKDVMSKGPWNRRLREAFVAYAGGKDTLALFEYLLASEMGLQTSRSNALHILHAQRGLEGVDVIRHRGDETIVENDVLVSTRRESELLSRGEAIDELVLTIILRAALEGDRTALLRLGDHYYQQGNYTRSLTCYQQASQGAGLAQAMFNLGLMYQYGLGTADGQPDFSTAKRYFDAAVQRSNVVSDGDAYYAVTGALYVLNFHYWLHYFSNRNTLSPGVHPSIFADLDDLWRLSKQPFGVRWDDWLLGISGVFAIFLLILRNQLADVRR